MNYSDQVQTDSVGNTVHVAVPVYKTLNGCSNIANLSFNKAPDLVIKATFDPGIGHYEIFGIGGFAHETIYPGETTNSNLYGGLIDVATGTAVAPALSSASSKPNSITLGGFGGSARVPLLAGKLSLGAKALYGPGIGRYGNSTLGDITSDANGAFAPIHNLSGLLTVEANPTPRLMIYLNYGGDYAGRTDFGAAGTTTSLGAPSANFCSTTAGVITCTTTSTVAQIAAGGKWGGHWGAPSNSAVGYGSRLINNSGCNTDSNPGYNGGASTGYAPGGSCGAQTRNVQEITGGYWYDIYKGDRGRLRRGLQYGYGVREGWSGASGIGAKGIDNMVWTTFRYYLP